MLSFLFSATLLLLTLTPLSSGLTYENVTLSTGITLSTLFHGKSDGETILFLHGFPEGSYSWASVFTSGVLDSYNLVAPDLRGYNRSTQASSQAGYTVDKIAADVTDLIGVLTAKDKTKKVHLVAHDWGGAIAWWVAAAHPELLHSYTAINIPHPLGWITGVREDPKQQEASTYVLSFMNPLTATFLTANNCAELQSIFTNESFWAEDGAAYLSSWTVPGSVNAGLMYYRANIKPNCTIFCTTADCWHKGVTSTFDNIPNGGIIVQDLPVRVLWGMLDTAFDNDYQLAFLTKVVKGSLEVTQYPNNSHWLPQEEPVAVAQAVAKFVGGK